MFRKKHYLALGAVTLLALLILSLPPRVTARLKLAAGSLFLPLFGLANTTQQLPADLANTVHYDGAKAGGPPAVLELVGMGPVVTTQVDENGKPKPQAAAH